ncbi:hypothetical protein SAMN04487905_102101 [Actinopolyspora xinjiangensis]|uniref:Uncharacterized protein n=1 Tax=Actinopolyspora xinjiangensis TaxID=405564 RepID=A0A1H0Q8A7_9ACTN|nr:hypothetical protein SAMN04487905_102101 [Actinopolyspora xinjiangensis]
MSRSRRAMRAVMECRWGQRRNSGWSEELCRRAACLDGTVAAHVGYGWAGSPAPEGSERGCHGYWPPTPPPTGGCRPVPWRCGSCCRVFHGRPDWGRSASLFFARTLAASTIARDQSSCPEPPSSSSTAGGSLRQISSHVQRWNHRCAPRDTHPDTGSRCRQAHSLVTTNTIAVNTDRTSAGARPPPYGSTPACGTNGSTNTHNSPPHQPTRQLIRHPRSPHPHTTN